MRDAPVETILGLAVGGCTGLAAGHYINGWVGSDIQLVQDIAQYGSAGLSAITMGAIAGASSGRYDAPPLSVAVAGTTLLGSAWAVASNGVGHAVSFTASMFSAVDEGPNDLNAEFAKYNTGHEHGITQQVQPGDTVPHQGAIAQWSISEDAARGYEQLRGDKIDMSDYTTPRNVYPVAAM